MIRYELYFGRNIGNEGQIVSDKDWHIFLRNSIANRFDGFSIHYLTGYWQGVMERTVKIEITIPNVGGRRNDIDEIRQAYCERFDQESVMLVISDAEVSF